MALSGEKGTVKPVEDAHDRRRRGSAAERWLILTTLVAILAVLLIVFALTEGIGRPDIPPGAIVVVEDVPPEFGTITEAEFRRALQQAALEAGLRRAPRPGEAGYQGLRDRATSILIDRIWLPSYAEGLGISVSEGEITARIKRMRGDRSEGEYARFLKGLGYTPGDWRNRVRTEILFDKLNDRLEASVPEPSDREIEDYYEEAKSTRFATPDGARPLDEVKAQIKSDLIELAAQEVVANFGIGYYAGWRSRTLCASGYVTERCANFQPEVRAHPPATPPACYLDTPASELPDSCPAPVTQRLSARPGTISPVVPMGERLAQRPVPAGLEPVN